MVLTDVLTSCSHYVMDTAYVQRNPLSGAVVKWVARLTRDRWIPVSHEFEPHQRPPLFPRARNCTLIA